MINFISRQGNLLPAINSIMRNCAPVSFLYYIYCELCDDEGCFVKTLVSSLQYLESKNRIINRESHLYASIISASTISHRQIKNHLN